MKSVVIIQARMASKRLPGKVLLQLGGRSVLSHVIERCQAIPNVDQVCCAISESSSSDPVAKEAEHCAVTIFRGSEEDVLDRYYRAAIRLDAKIIVRVTSDCPMIDPEIVAQVIDLLIEENGDFATNNLPPSWPHGLDCEAFKFNWLKRAWKESKEPDDREHVSPYIRRHPEAKILNLEGPGGPLIDHRWTLDYPEDLDFARALFAEFDPDRSIPCMAEILKILRIKPEIANLNRMHIKAKG